jgi:hypothetical protein
VLRKLYESTWDATLLAQDQRCIYAICADERYGGHGLEQYAKTLPKNALDYMALTSLLIVETIKSVMTFTMQWHQHIRKVSNALSLPI